MLRPHPQCHCDRSSLASPSFYCFISVPWRTFGEAPALRPCTCLPLSWWKTMRKNMFIPLPFLFHHSLWLSNFRLGGRLRCGRDKWILHWELCHPVSMADVPPGSSWFLCGNCSHDLHRVGIDIRHVNIISTDSLARREMLIINYWSWHLW